VTQKYWPGSKSTSRPSRSKTTSSVPFATSRVFLDLRAHLPNLPRAAQTGFGQARGERGLRIATPVPQRMIEQRLDDPPGLLDRVLAG